MTDEPKAKVRLAKWTDRHTFFQMWRPLLEVQHSLGSIVLPTDHNLREFGQMFESYTVGSLFGLGVVAEVGDKPVGFLLFGEEIGGLNVETSVGRTGIVWGSWVDPAWRRRGISHQMLTFGYGEAHQMGFRCVMSSVLLDSKEANANALNYPGVKAYATMIYNQLEDPPHGERK